MTMIRFACPGCQTTLKVADLTLVGRKIKCPMCKTIVAVPAAPAPPPAEPEMELLESPAPAPAARGAEEDEALASLMEAAQEEAAQNGTPKAPAASGAEEDEALAALMEAAQEEAAQNGTPKAPAASSAEEGSADFAEELMLEAAQEELLTEAPTAPKRAGKTDVDEADEDLPVRKRGRKDEDEDDLPARKPKSKPAAASQKQGGGLLMAVFVVLVMLGYGGALGATLAGTFDEKPPATMTEDEALKVLKMEWLKGRPKGKGPRGDLGPVDKGRTAKAYGLRTTSST